MSGTHAKATSDRESNPRLVSRQTWWIEYGRWQIGATNGPICTECADPMPDGAFIGALVCEECSPYVPEAERWL